MYSFRPFRNSDPPHIAHIWASQPPQRGLAQPLSVAHFEQSLYSKHYFDPNGLILAEQDGKPVGFAHGSFGPNDELSGMSFETGTTQIVMVRPDLWGTDLPDQLLRQTENYLRGRGARVLYAGGIQPLNAFYLGLYGGSELPGVLLSDTNLQVLLKRNNYHECSRVVVLHRDLVRFRAPVSRNQRKVKREVVFETTYAPETISWWEAQVVGNQERIRFQIIGRRNHKKLASCTFWDIEPLATGWGLRSAGLQDLVVDQTVRRQGYATFLLSESFRELHKRGVTLVEVQTMESNTPAMELYKSLGFAPVDYGIVFRRNSDG